MIRAASIASLLCLMSVLFAPAPASALKGLPGELFGGGGLCSEPNDDDITDHVFAGAGYRVSHNVVAGLEVFGLRTHGRVGYRFRYHWTLYGRLELLPRRVFNPYVRAGLGLADFSYSDKGSGLLLEGAGGLILGSKNFGFFSELSLRDGNTATVIALSAGVRIN